MGLLVDRDFGLAAWQPAWLLIVPAIAALAGAPAARLAALALPLAAGWLVATFVALTMQGWWFPGRQVVVVLPAAVLAIAWWARGGGARLAATLALGAVGVVAHAWIAAEGALGRIAWVVDLQEHRQPALPRLDGGPARLPRRTAATWALHWAWTALLVAWPPARRGGASSPGPHDADRRAARAGA